MLFTLNHEMLHIVTRTYDIKCILQKMFQLITGYLIVVTRKRSQHNKQQQ